MFPGIIIKTKKIIDSSFLEPDFLSLLFENRQIKPSNYDDFLNPHFPITSDFDVCQNELKKGVERVIAAIKNNENILIYGDYDVDGITATAILWQVLSQNGAKVLPFIPDRETDGYGVKSKSFFDFEIEKKIHFDLLITVDNGIVANQELSKIAKKNTDIIITDHHLPNKNLPPALAIIHSVNFSGASLAWLFASQFGHQADIGLAAAGTVADCLPLTKINRNLVIHGLTSLQKNPSPGIEKLIKISGLKQESLSAYDLGFVIGPRLNAVGRLSNPTEALRLLCSQNPVQAENYAKILDKYNKDRQDIQKKDLIIAEENIDLSSKLIFNANKDFLPGIIGLIAGRLTEKYYLPSIIVSVGDEFSKGSCRSIKELNIIETLRNFDHDLVDLGGHAGAAGFTIKTKNLKKFQIEITNFINQRLKDVSLKSTVSVEAEMKLSALTVNNCRLLEKFEPFGIDNPKPLFLFKKLRIVSKKVLGLSGDHLKLRLDDPDTKRLENIVAEGIAFKKGDLDKKIKIGEIINLIASLEINRWNGQTTPQLVIKEIFV